MDPSTSDRASGSRAATNARGAERVAPAIFLRLAADGSATTDQRSVTRRLAMALAVLGLLLSVPLYWAATAHAADDGGETAVFARAETGDEDDDDGDDDATNGDTGTATDAATGAETRSGINTDAGLAAQFTGASTVGETDPGDNTGATEQTQGTGAETRGQTDPRADAGASTVGETDPGDNTGATEQR